MYGYVRFLVWADDRMILIIDVSIVFSQYEYLCYAGPARVFAPYIL